MSWDRPNDSRVTGYKIFYGLEDTNFKSAAQKNINSPARTSCDIFGLKAGYSYSFAAKSFDKKGNESVFSEVLYYDVPETRSERSSGGGGGCFIIVISDLNIWN